MKYRRTEYSQDPTAERVASHGIMENSPLDEKSTISEHEYEHPRIQVTSIDDLNAGDHICFKTDPRYEHHGIVLNCFPHEETPVFNVVEVLGTRGGGDVKEAVWVFECVTHMVPTDGSLYTIQYKEGECLPASHTTLIASLMIGKPVRYNIFTRNCEHFTSALRTGTGTSEHVSTLAALTAGMVQPPGNTLPLEDLMEELKVKTNGNHDNAVQCVPDAEAIVEGIFDNMVEEALALVQSSESIISDVHFEFVQSKSGKKKKKKKRGKSKPACTLL